MNGKKSEQLILNLGNEPTYDVGEYIILPSTELMTSQLLSDQKLASPVTILFGANMSGKTHLAHLWQDKFNAQFLPKNLLNVQENNIPELANFVKNNAIIIDDIDKKIGCNKTIFHIINLAIQHNQLLLFTANKSLVEWGIELPDLLSRLKAAKHLEIPPPEDMLIEIILTKTFAQKQLNVADNVIAYILPRIGRSLEAVINVVNSIDKHAFEQNKPITRTMVAKLLENVI